MWTFTGTVDGAITSVTLRPHVIHPNKITNTKAKRTRFQRLSGHDHPVGESLRQSDTWLFSGEALLATPLTQPNRAIDPEEVLWTLQDLYDSGEFIRVFRERAGLPSNRRNQSILGGAAALWDITNLGISYGNIKTLEAFRHRSQPAGPQSLVIGEMETRPLTADWRFTITRMR